MEDILLSKFSASLSTDKQICKEAKEYLKGIRSNPGLMPLIVKISLEVTHSEEVRQVAATFLKNLCTIDWNNCESNLFIPYVDNDLLKVRILTCFSLSIHIKSAGSLKR